MMVMADFSSACSGEERLCLVRAGFVVGIFDGVVDPLGVKPSMQSIPGWRLIRMDRGGPIDPGPDKGDGGLLSGEDGWQCSAQTEAGARPFADHHDDLALAILVLGQTAVLAVGLPVDRPDVPTVIGALDFVM